MSERTSELSGARKQSKQVGASKRVSGGNGRVSGAGKRVSGAGKRVSGASERVSGASKRVSGASEHVSGASEQANGQASGPILLSVFLAVIDHSALIRNSVSVFSPIQIL